jgi:hypothetical protein
MTGPRPAAAPPPPRHLLIRLSYPPDRGSPRLSASFERSSSLLRHRAAVALFLPGALFCCFRRISPPFQATRPAA